MNHCQLIHFVVWVPLWGLERAAATWGSRLAVCTRRSRCYRTWRRQDVPWKWRSWQGVLHRKGLRCGGLGGERWWASSRTCCASSGRRRRQGKEGCGQMLLHLSVVRCWGSRRGSVLSYIGLLWQSWGRPISPCLITDVLHDCVSGRWDSHWSIPP